MQMLGKRTLGMLFITVILTMLATSAVFCDTENSAITTATADVLQKSNDKVMEDLESTKYTLEEKADLLGKEENRLHNIAEQLRANDTTNTSDTVALVQDLWKDTRQEKKVVLAQMNATKETLDEIKNSSLSLNDKIAHLTEKENLLNQYAELLRNSGVEENDQELLNAKELWKETRALKKELQASLKTNHRYGMIAQKITPEEMNLLAKVLYLEAHGESNQGQQALIEVIFNRVNSKRFPNTINGVLYAPNQFTCVKYLYRAKPTNKEYSNIQAVLNGQSNILSNTTVYFNGTPLNNRIDKKIGGHYFCKL